jgi:hypothetical protein
VVTWKKKKKRRKKKKKRKKVSKCFKCDANSLFRPPLDPVSATLSSRELDEGFRCKVDEATLSYPCIFSVRDKTFPVSSSFWSFACQVDVSCWSFERHPEWCCPWIRGCSHEDHEPHAIPCHPMPSHAIPNGLLFVQGWTASAEMLGEGRSSAWSLLQGALACEGRIMGLKWPARQNVVTIGNLHASLFEWLQHDSLNVGALRAPVC